MPAKHHSTDQLIDDHIVDDLLRLQSRFATLLWRLKEQDGIEVEFFLEELAIDCAACLRRAGIAAQHLPERPRVLRLPPGSACDTERARTIAALTDFLQAHNPIQFHFNKE